MTIWAVRYCSDHCDQPPRLRCMRPSQIVETMCSRRFDIVVRHTERLFSCLGCFAGCVDTALSRSITHLPLPPGKKDDTQSRCLTRAQHRLVSYIARIRCLSVTRGQRRLHRSGYSLMRGSPPPGTGFEEGERLLFARRLSGGFCDGTLRFGGVLALEAHRCTIWRERSSMRDGLGTTAVHARVLVFRAARPSRQWHHAPKPFRVRGATHPRPPCLSSIAAESGASEPFPVRTLRLHSRGPMTQDVLAVRSLRPFRRETPLASGFPHTSAP